MEDYTIVLVSGVTAFFVFMAMKWYESWQRQQNIKDACNFAMKLLKLGGFGALTASISDISRSIGNQTAVHASSHSSVSESAVILQLFHSADFENLVADAVRKSLKTEKTKEKKRLSRDLSFGEESCLGSSIGIGRNCPQTSGSSEGS